MASLKFLSSTRVCSRDPKKTPCHDKMMPISYIFVFSDLCFTCFLFGPHDGLASHPGGVEINSTIYSIVPHRNERLGVLMVSALDSGSSGPGLIHGTAL